VWYTRTEVNEKTDHQAHQDHQEKLLLVCFVSWW
jgi:hypothetical protein